MRFTRIVCTLAIAFVLQADPARATQSTAIPGERTWMLEAANGFGMITAIERCGDVLFIADTRQQIRRFDISAGKLLTSLGGDRVAFPTALVSDCQRRRFFVITGIPLRAHASAAVQLFDLESGDLIREYPLPASFLPRPGGRFEAPSSLIVSGLWVPPDRSPAELIHVPAARYYEGLHLGVKLSVETGNVEPLLVPYETRCIGAGQCPDVRVDAILSQHGPVRVAALPTSTAIGIYEAGAASPRLVDVRSPRYVRDGTTLEPSDSVEVRMKWLGPNSTLNHVFAFADVVVAVHARPQIGPGYHVGQPTQFTAYMNVYGWDGNARTCDIPLPDLAVGRDDSHVYVIDYGTERRRDGAQKLRLVQIPVGHD